MSGCTRPANRLVSGNVARYATDLSRIWAVERPFELHLPDGRVSGRADVILDEEIGRIGSLAIMDYKVAAGAAVQRIGESVHRIRSAASPPGEIDRCRACDIRPVCRHCTIPD